MRDLIDLIDFIKVAVTFMAILFAVIFLIWFVIATVEKAECNGYGRQTGREVAYDFGCYARNDDGQMVPVDQIGKNITVKTK